MNSAVFFFFFMIPILNILLNVLSLRMSHRDYRAFYCIHICDENWNLLFENCKKEKKIDTEKGQKSRIRR